MTHDLDDARHSATGFRHKQSVTIMIKQSIAAGFTGIRRRPGLVVLIYAMNLVLAFVLSIPVAIALGSAVGGTGFDGDLSRGFDIVLWADVIEEISTTARRTGRISPSKNRLPPSKPTSIPRTRSGSTSTG